MCRKTILWASALWFGWVSPCIAQQTLEIAIWPGVAPGSERTSTTEEWTDRKISDGTNATRDRSVKGVTKPTATIYLPEAKRANGAAVVVCPGGAFTHLAIDKEGHDVANWLRSESSD